MPLFQPPVVYDNPPVLEDVPIFPRGTPQQRLFGHMRSRPRGRTILLLKAGPCVAVDYPTQLVPGSPAEGDVWTEQGLAGYTYDEIARVFMGGHVYVVSDAEAAQLVTCGYGSGLTDAEGYGMGGFGERGFGE